MRKKKIIIVLALCAVLIGVLLAVYFLSPEVKQAVDYKIATWRIEHKLEDKYDVEFEVLENSIAEGNELPFYPVRYPKADAKYSFMATFEAKGEKHLIVGIVDKKINIISDSYAHYLYKDEMLQALTDAVSEVIPVEKILAVCNMDPKEVVTLSEDTDSFEAFMEGTKTYEPLYMLIDEDCSEEQLALVKATLEEQHFPFSVLITTNNAKDISALRDNNIRCLFESYPDFLGLVSDNYWLENLEENGEYYLWYADEDVLYNADQYDQIIKDVE